MYKYHTEIENLYKVYIKSIIKNTPVFFLIEISVYDVYFKLQALRDKHPVLSTKDVFLGFFFPFWNGRHGNIFEI